MSVSDWAVLMLMSFTSNWLIIFAVIYLLTGDILQVFGASTLEYVMQLIQGQIDYLPRLPKHIVIHIVQFLELSDIAALAQVSKQFRRVTLI